MFVWNFNIVFYDTTGSEGGPGNLVDSIPVSVPNAPIYPSIVYFTFSNLYGVPPLYNGSYYIGISYNSCLWKFDYIGYIGTGNYQRPGYLYYDTTWYLLQTYYPQIKILGIRAEQNPQQTTQSLCESFDNNFPPAGWVVSGSAASYLSKMNPGYYLNFSEHK